MEFLVLTKTAGFLGPIAEILGYIMDLLFRFTSVFGIMNIGLCIILFTLVIKVLMFPLTIKQQKSSKLMSIMQPELQAIQKKYKGKTDQESMMKMNVETKAVYEKYGTSMTGGCLQLLIQMPILFALYRVIYNIPAYVSSVKMYFEEIVNAITGVTGGISGLPEGAANNLVEFADAQGVVLTGLNAIGDLTGVAGEALGNKMIDVLYLLKPAQWESLKVAFPNAVEAINRNYENIEGMNSFLGINLAATPWTGMVPTVAWLIPILAGLTQWYSTKLMTANQTMNEDTPGAQSMKMMNTTMPLMSVFFCFTFPAGIGIYWIASSFFQVVQQLAVNSYLNKIDVDEMIKKNIEKANKKRAKKGLPPTKVTQNASANLKSIQAKEEKEEAERAEKIEKSKDIIKESTNYYNSNAKPGSLAAKANMVQKYNEKHNK